MTLTARMNDDNMAESSQQSLRQLQQSLTSVQHLHHQQQQPQQPPSSPFQEAGALVPEGNDGCLRFYKGLAGRDRRQSVAAASAAASAARRSRRRWPEKRTRSLAGIAGCFWAQHNCSEGESAMVTDLLTSVDQGPGQGGRASRDQEMAARPVRTSTLDTRSSDASVSSDNSQRNNQIDNSTPKVRYIYYKGRLQPVEIMQWPEQPRIPACLRYRLEEPMKQQYGKRSLFNRLLRAMERSSTVVEAVDPSEIRGPIPLLPRHMTEATKTRLKLWYKRLDTSGQFDVAAAAAAPETDATPLGALANKLYG